ncbi:DEAD/DEAH box helicase [Sphingopyxis sp. GW247-27LB]|uniref:DEAD/DEAH box helicase n=1 Tax=Sphingopyxis sp. GW247-27LB TaxID=2012632 RepID=UPI000BA6CA7B|nr:DEAD/DEAH box helicase [Sphingopyxis sp. GW247-27LB]PAL25004.1 DEAD/DEAH box helicase [Sphingopyxis sp. GW247-27LB]
MTTFNDFGLHADINRALAAKDYTIPTPIQVQAIPPLMKGRDLCGIAQTGTGKTAGFSLPSIHHLLTYPHRATPRGCRMLVLAPTRELAAQIAQSCRDYGRFTKLSVSTVFGGVPINKQIRDLAKGVDILVATPGRLLDLIDQRALRLDDVEIFVLDEADQMMDMGFIHSLRRVAKLLPSRRQNLFFSATMPKEIAGLADQFLNDPVTVSVAPQATTAEKVRQQITFVEQKEKQALLHHVLKTEDIDRALIFTRTKHGADRVVRHLAGAGIQAYAIHGNKSQAQRTTALQAFRSGQVRLLVATDIAARGIDVSGVSHVINFEIPNVPEQYVHRIGRTARAGAEGIAISFVAPDEKAYLRDIERVTRTRAEPVKLPDGFSEMVRNLPKPAQPPRNTGGKGRDPQRQREDAQRQRDGGKPRGDRGPRHEAAPAADGQGQRKRRFRPRRGGVGAHKGAVTRVG